MQMDQFLYGSFLALPSLSELFKLLVFFTHLLHIHTLMMEASVAGSHQFI